MPRSGLFVSIALIAALIMLGGPHNRSLAWDAPEAQPKSPSSKSDVSDVLSAYEQIRALLAADKVNGLASAAGRLASAAQRAHLSEISKAAEPLARAKDLASARKAFGRLSRQVVAVVEADPELRKRLHLFECPMVTAGENQWLQPTDTIENPYMGRKMPTCGTRK